MIISSRTPEGEPNRCPVCGSAVRVEPSLPALDAPCPACGCLLWFRPPSAEPGEAASLAAEAAKLAVGWLLQVGATRLGAPDRATVVTLHTIRDARQAELLERHLGQARSWDDLFCRVWDEEARLAEVAE
jgi:hypothetical protein